MDQIYPLAGTTTTSCASQDFDFLNYWVDQTIEKEILRGKNLRELKKRPSIRQDKYDVINIGNTNVFRKKKRSKRRNKSPPKSKKKGRRNSPQRKNSPTRLFPKQSKSGRHRCSLRIAELSVPSKRQCIDTWRTKYHVLPGIMIDRLRQHVMDLTPVVKIPDAIECFKRHKKMERRKNKEAKEKKIKREIKKCDNCNDKTKKKSTKVQECRYLCAIFGHKIAKQLNKPVQITLNTELQKISNVVSIEIEKLLNKGKRADSRNIKNKKVQAEVSSKIAIWISSILDETAYAILEDQLKDLEEEVGPVLDLIDDLVDNVVDVCEPEPEFIEVLSSSETYNIESSTDDERHEETQDDDNLSVEIDVLSETEPVELNLDDFIKNELDHIINSFDGDIPSDVEDINFMDDVENQTIQNNTEFHDIKNQAQHNNIEFEGDKEQNEFVDANDTFEVPLTEPDTQTDIDILHAENKDGNLDTDHERDADPDLPIDLVSEDDSNKKVKFSDVTDDSTTEKLISEYFNPDQFPAPNNNLLSNADESWPEDLVPPILRPSESASKSITSLGNIMEAEERMSIMFDDDASAKQIRVLNDTTADEKFKRLDENADISNDSTINSNILDKIHDIANTNNEQLKDQDDKDGIELTDKYIISISKDGTVYTKDQEIEKDEGSYKKGQNIEEDSTEQTEKYTVEDGKSYTKKRPIDTYGREQSNQIIEKNEAYTEAQDFEKDSTKLTDTDEDGKSYTKEQLIERYGEARTNEMIEKDGITYTEKQNIEKENSKLTDKYTDEDGKPYTKEQFIEKYGIEQTNQIIEERDKTYTKAQDFDKDSTNLTDKYTRNDGKTYTKDQLIEKYGIERTNQIIKEDTTYTEVQDIEKDSTRLTNKYIGEDGKTYAKDQRIEKYGTKLADQIIGKAVKSVQRDLSHLATDDGIHRPSTDSIFHHDVLTKPVPYEQKLEKILEEQATQVAVLYKLLEDEAIQVGLKDETRVTYKKEEIETADKEINTSFSLVPRADKSTSVVSQSLGDITKRLQGVKANDMFSSLRIKPRVDYKVHKNSAPSWVTRNFGEPTESSYTTSQHQKKGSYDKNIRLWCKDLENGFDNLELWNGWMENTVERLKTMEINKARICKDKSREQFVRDWLHLKKNVDVDVLTWTKLSKSTREKLKGFRKIYQNFETPPPPPPEPNKV